jgi:polyphosphate kinase 2 (PPK2 family)
MARSLHELSPAENISEEDYELELAHLQRHLAHLRLATAGLVDGATRGPAITVLFEGFDAAGKGGAIRRVTEALDPRLVRVIPISAPTPLELRHHFLWRFHADLPGQGDMTIYDRSWYGRLLVERVEELISADVVIRSAREIVNFERSLTDDGHILVKIWMNVSDDVQLERFNDRAADPLKKWKLTDDDWRNRKKRKDYEEAVEDMLALTDAPDAPWHLINGDHKRSGRLQALRAVIVEIERGLRRLGLPVPASHGDDYLESDS